MDIVGQPLRIFRWGTKKEIEEKVEHLLEEVGLNPRYKTRYPHQFSVGQRQRIGIARAIALEPELIICDESVSALDVSIQAQVMNLLLDLQEKYNLTYMFIAHDLSVVEFISSRILVMYLGKVVEQADKKTLVEHHLHPYTTSLFAASPGIDPGKRDEDVILLGDVPSPLDPPSGCYFHPRCLRCMDICKKVFPDTREISPGHRVACHLY
jgi:oligopeptide/dipeptide ABC transporter ATP-binding protein